MSRPKVKCYDLRSTRALRVEGDSLQNAGRSRPNHNFYPRPPGGGRRRQRCTGNRFAACISIHALRVEGDYGVETLRVLRQGISIHALRVEGDTLVSRPTETAPISIHALRVEGDGFLCKVFAQLLDISIHALRVEGDRSSSPHTKRHTLFLSTPSGWRATDLREPTAAPEIFLSTPSGWRATL